MQSKKQSKPLHQRSRHMRASASNRTRVLHKNTPTVGRTKNRAKPHVAHGTNTPQKRRTTKNKRPLKNSRAGAKYTSKKKPTRSLPSPGENLRIVPLGGVEQIGQNMTVIEYKDDIVVVDAGFEFPEIDTPGIDYIIPDVTYLEERKEKIRGIFITHGHYDHIGAIPHIMEKIGNPPIYSREFGALIIKKRQEEYTQAPPLDIKIVGEDETITLGKHFSVRTFSISHAIPDSMGLIIKTPIGNVVTVSDVRVDHVDGIPTKKEIAHYSVLKKEKTLLFMLDSTNVANPGFSRPESAAIAGVDKFVKQAKGRVIIGTFASQVERMIEFIKIAEKYHRKVIIDGRSMKGNIEIVKHLGLVETKNIIPIEEMTEHPPSKILILATGGQGEEYSVLDRVAKKTHRFITLDKSDTLILSSSIIPGNEYSITKLKDKLYRSEAHIVTYLDSDVHASGHGNRGELEWIHKQIDYHYFMPMHGNHYMLRIHAELADSLGVPKSHVMVPDNGSIVEISPDGKTIRTLKEKAPAERVMVDGFSIADTHDVVLRDRQSLATDGIFVIVGNINPKTGKLRKSPDIITRGFVHIQESKELLKEAREVTRKSIEKNTGKVRPINFDQLKKAVVDDVRRFLRSRTAKSPIVIPVIIGV